MAGSHEHPPLRRYTLLGASSLTVMAGATISPTIPAMQDHFSEVPEVALLTRLVLTVPGLFIALFSLLAGAVVDRFGRKRLLIFSTLLYTLSGSAGLVLDDLSLILASRAVLGIAVAGVMTSATTLIGDYFSGPARDRFMGLQAAFMGFGGVVFLLAGGWLGDWHWRGPFGVYLLALLLIPGMIRGIYEPPRHRPRGADTGEPPRLPRWRVAGLYLAALAGMLTFYMVPVQIPYRLRELGLGSSALAGLTVATCTLCSALTATQFGRIREYLTHPAILALSFVLLGAGLVLAGWVDRYLQLLPGMALVGMGMGLMMPNFSLWLMGLAPLPLRGRVVGGLTMAIFIGQFVSPLVVMPLLAVTDIAGSLRYTGSGAGVLGLVIGGGALLGWAGRR